jgi:RNA-directed DNA polymerase
MSLATTGNRMTTTDMANKPFMIEKRRVYEAYKAVKSSKGAAGVDGQTIEQFEANLKGNLYKIWNRMSSGTYFHHRSALSPFRKRAEAKGFWVCPP